MTDEQIMHPEVKITTTLLLPNQLRVYTHATIALTVLDQSGKRVNVSWATIAARILPIVNHVISSMSE